MNLFALNEDVARLDARLSTLHGQDRLALLVEMAWHLRQRDCARAEILVQEAHALLDSAGLSAVERRRITARLDLVQAEGKLLFAHLADAKSITEAAHATFQELKDSIGQGDALWLMASIGVDRGDGDMQDSSLERAMVEYEKAGDGQRELAAMARRLVYDAFRDPAGTGQELVRAFPENIKRAPAVENWVLAARANVAGLTNDPGNSIKNDLAAYHAGLATGQIRQALVSAINAVETFAMLGDLDAAMEWGEPALELARSTGWPASIGVCQMQLGDVLRALSRYDEARSLLQEALERMEVIAGSRNYEQVLGRLGQLELDTGDFAKGLEWFEKFEERVQTHQEPDLLIKAWRGQASALHKLGRFQDAHAKATTAMALARAQESADGQIQLLGVLAQIHIEPGLPAPANMTAPSAGLHYLLQARALADSMNGYTLPYEMLQQLAAAYAACGDYRSAYENSMAANESRNASRIEETQRRAVAMQVRHEIERARAETDRHREMAETLRETAATLETLGMIGREITASLDSTAVFETLHRHVDQLLDATVFCIWLIDENHTFLVPAFVIENGAPLYPRPVSLTSPVSHAARSARKREEIVLNLESSVDSPNLVPGSLPTSSVLYSPLIAGERLLGVMSIQSPRRNVYGEREQSIFRALCAYGAIALDNAAAYAVAATAERTADKALEELRQTQSQLVEQNLQLERLAVTDQLTGLYNRLRLDRTLEEEHSRNMRYGASFCVLLLDLDEFKAVNDTYGHQMGDQVLSGIAHILQEGVRDVDVVGRWGGEEFLVVCRETAIDGAMVLAEKLRSAIHDHVFPGLGKKSASFGVAMFRTGEVLTETIARADAALYRAKQLGRNRVESGEDDNQATLSL